MHKNDYLYTLHNIDTVRELVNSATTAFCDLHTDSCLVMEIGFERIFKMDTTFDTFSTANIDILKAADYRAPPRIQSKWNSEDQQSMYAKEEPEDNTRQSQKLPLKWSLNEVSRRLEYKPKKTGSSGARMSMVADETKPYKKHRARLIEIPTAEYYAARLIDLNTRALNFRKSIITELHTALELPAIREKGDANDRTDRDCRSLEIGTETSDTSTSKMMERKKKATTTTTTTTSESDTAVKSPPIEFKYAPNIRRRPDRGDLEILRETNGNVLFVASTRRMGIKPKH
ncbi:unnamed protein product [Caenorhabditis bovis]|uniref:Uncharacterized protein n=1 Tax=Caenorhabditis bovis TaxID=2654633 RepID=A0A8S1FDY0_9PELO|nr:unnamed protein product [Caenorhabditis bovis]